MLSFQSSLTQQKLSIVKTSSESEYEVTHKMLKKLSNKLLFGFQYVIRDKVTKLLKLNQV